VSIRAHDPAGLDNLQGIYGPRITYCPEPYDALDGADFLTICTEWNAFRSPEFDRLSDLLTQPIVFDGRNLYDLETMKREGIEYHPIGRPAVNAGGRS